jgi:LPS export ABC transporter protein LptC
VRRVSWSIAVAAAAAGGSLWLQLHTADEKSARPGAAARPDLYIEQPRWELLDARGRTARRLQAQRLEQWPGESTARLIAPHLQLRGAAARRWQLQAARGRLSADGRSLLLEERVSLRPHPDTGGLRITTERLHIAAGGRVETDSPVVLESRNWHFSAGGLRADPDRQHIELVNRVKGTHD